MDNIELVFPMEGHEESAWAYRQEHIDCGEQWINGSDGLIRAGNYQEWLDKVTEARTVSQQGRVNSSTYFVFNGGTIVGTIQIRHDLNEKLKTEGGHIGYGVRPSCRRNGYGTKMLALALEKCREIGLEKVLLTCDSDNVGSAKVMVKNGGVFEREIIAENGDILHHYWITL